MKNCIMWTALSVLKDESGNMNTEYSGGDGIHLNSAAYDLMLDQLRRSIS